MPTFSLEVILYGKNDSILKEIVLRLAPNQITSKEKAICKKGAIRSYKITSKEIVDGKRLKMANKTLRSEIVAQKGAQRWC